MTKRQDMIAAGYTETGDPESPDWIAPERFTFIPDWVPTANIDFYGWIENGDNGVPKQYNPYFNVEWNGQKYDVPQAGNPGFDTAFLQSKGINTVAGPGGVALVNPNDPAYLQLQQYLREKYNTTSIFDLGPIALMAAVAAWSFMPVLSGGAAAASGDAASLAGEGFGASFDASGAVIGGTAGGTGATAAGVVALAPEITPLSVAQTAMQKVAEQAITSPVAETLPQGATIAETAAHAISTASGALPAITAAVGAGTALYRTINPLSPGAQSQAQLTPQQIATLDAQRKAAQNKNVLLLGAIAAGVFLLAKPVKRK